MAPNKNTINNNEFTVLLARLTTAASASASAHWYKYLVDLSNLQHSYEFADSKR